MARIECVYPIVHAKENLLPSLKNREVLSFEGLNEELVLCFERLLQVPLPDSFESDLSRLRSAPINEESKTILANYVYLVYLTCLIEDSNGQASEVLYAIENIKDERASKDFYYELYTSRLSEEVQKLSSIAELKAALPKSGQIPNQSFDVVSNLVYIKVNSLIDITNQNLVYMANTFKDLTTLSEIQSIGQLTQFFYSNIIEKIKLFESVITLPDEIKEKIDVPTKDHLIEALNVAHRANLTPEQTNELSLLSSNLSITVDTTPIAADSSETPKPRSNREEHKSLPKNNDVEISLSTQGSKDFEFHFEGVEEILDSLPIKSWDQIRKLERIIRIEDKGMEVWKAVIKDSSGNDLIVAVKTNLSKKRLTSISMQAEYMAIVQDNNNFLRLYGAFWDVVGESHRFTIVMELAVETLTQRIQRWEKEKINKAEKETEALNAAKLLIESMTVLNQKDISHRDIKPDNIFITAENNYKIADFDVSRKIQRDQYGITETNMKVSLSGTHNFMSPELKAYAAGMGAPQGVDYNKSDVYSLGITILRMITSDNFLGWNLPSDSLQGNMFSLIDKHIENDDLKKIIKAMFIYNQADRPKFRELLMAFQMNETTCREDEYA